MKTIDQIVTEQLHHIAEKCESDPRFLKSTTPEIIGASLLCEIAHSGHAAYVMKALSALGIATSLSDVGVQFEAVRARRAECFRASGIDPVAEAEAKLSNDPIMKFLDGVEAKLKESIKAARLNDDKADPRSADPAPAQAQTEAVA